MSGSRYLELAERLETWADCDAEQFGEPRKLVTAQEAAASIRELLALVGGMVEAGEPIIEYVHEKRFQEAHRWGFEGWDREALAKRWPMDFRIAKIIPILRKAREAIGEAK